MISSRSPSPSSMTLISVTTTMESINNEHSGSFDDNNAVNDDDEECDYDTDDI